MRLLGVILAGGKSVRFGSDKALPVIDGKPLMQHAIDKLQPQVDMLVSFGHAWPGLISIEDRPSTGIGPLGGLNAALKFAAAQGFDAVISVPVDTYPLSRDLVSLLVGPQASYLLEHCAIGFWPASLARALDRHIARSARSVMSWIDTCDASPIGDSWEMANINRPQDVPSQ